METLPSASGAEPSAANLPVPPADPRPPIAPPTLRPGRAEDAADLGRICHDAFAAIAARHAFPKDFPDAETAAGLFRFMLEAPDVHVVVAEAGGRVIGSNALWQQTPIAGVGPITIDPAMQDAAVGRALMRDVIERADAQGHPGVRLVQAAYHNRSLALYTKLGFDAREPLSVFQGTPPAVALPGRRVRAMDRADTGACAALAERVLGFSRAGELPGAIAEGSAMLVERDGRITGYTAQVGFFGHSLAETDEDLFALIAAAPSYPGPGFLAPTRNAALMRWCLGHGLRLVQPMTLMTRGAYVEPRGAWMPSILF